MNKTILHSIFCVFLFAFSGSSFAQVTIGSIIKPTDGALLDLKENAPDVNNVTSTKGLRLPRVELTDMTNLFPMFCDDGSGGYKIGTTPYTKATEDIAHRGLMVYNVNKCIDSGKGLYVWDGTKWQFLGEKEASASDVRTITDDGTEVTISYNGETTSYRYSTFGAAGTWMTENLATQYLPNGAPLTRHTANSVTDPQYFTPNNIADNSPLINDTEKQGLLYNWAAAMAGYVCSTDNQGQVAGATPGPLEVENTGPLGTAPHKYVQGICPAGWHLPSDREWNELEKAITEGANTYSTLNTYTVAQTIWTDAWETAANWHGNIQGAVMKSPGKVSGKTATNGTSKSSADGGFNILLAGSGFLGRAGSYGVSAYLWSSSSNGGSTGAWGRFLDFGSANVFRYDNYFRYNLFSVRCKKD